MTGRAGALDHDHVLALEEGAVADAARGHALAGELELAGDSEPARLGARASQFGQPLGDLGRIDAHVTGAEDRRVADAGHVGDVGGNVDKMPNDRTISAPKERRTSKRGGRKKSRR